MDGWIIVRQTAIIYCAPCRLHATCAHGPQTAVPRCSKLPEVLDPHLASRCSLIGQIDTHALLSRGIGQPVSASDTSLESLHSVQPSLSHFSASVLTASPTLISKQRFPLPLSGLQSESHSNTAANCIHQLDSVTTFTLHPICTTSSN
jgi:hypothetical protein